MIFLVHKSLERLIMFTQSSSHRQHHQSHQLVDSFLFAFIVVDPTNRINHKKDSQSKSRGLCSSHLRSLVACISYVCSMRSNDVIT